MTEQSSERGTGLGFTEILLAGVILLILTGVGMATGLYLLPAKYLQIPELQPGARVAREADFPVGASRLVNWGDRIMLVVRRGEDEYFALQGTSPSDGCILQWDAESRRIVSPCTYVVYDLFGNAVVGLSRTPLRRYPVFVRGGTVYVTG
jgi:nitrite reductase/ring-hydroxylating ferredoxin subunit